MADITFTDDALSDLNELDGNALRLVLGKLRLLRTNAEAGQPLGSQNQRNLTGFRKLVVGNRQWRIVYRIEPNGDVAVIWVVAGRADAECYDMAIQRLDRLGDRPPVRDLIQALEVLKPRVRRQVIRMSPPV